MLIVPPTTESTNKKEVQARVADWRDRLVALFRQIDEWRADILPDSTGQYGEVRQFEEGLMRDFKVKPLILPTYTILDGKRSISFKPDTLWNVGANGMVNIFAKHPPRYYSVFDRDGMEGRATDWQIAVKDYRKLMVPFDREVLAKVVADKL